jgi:hypothetical protein
MKFMNDYDVAMAAQRFTHPESAQYKAVRILQAHIEIVDNNSDGWAHWKAPVAAAKQLMELIERRDAPPQSLAHFYLKKAITPLRAFYTKHPYLPERPEGI